MLSVSILLRLSSLKQVSGDTSQLTELLTQRLRVVPDRTLSDIHIDVTSGVSVTSISTNIAALLLLQTKQCIIYNEYYDLLESDPTVWFMVNIILTWFKAIGAFQAYQNETVLAYWIRSSAIGLSSTGVEYRKLTSAILADFQRPQSGWKVNSTAAVMHFPSVACTATQSPYVIG
jgi:hypothetical protein